MSFPPVFFLPTKDASSLSEVGILVNHSECHPWNWLHLDPKIPSRPRQESTLAENISLVLPKPAYLEYAQGIKSIDTSPLPFLSIDATSTSTSSIFYRTIPKFS